MKPSEFRLTNGLRLSILIDENNPHTLMVLDDTPYITALRAQRRCTQTHGVLWEVNSLPLVTSEEAKAFKVLSVSDLSIALERESLQSIVDRLCKGYTPIGVVARPKIDGTTQLVLREL